MTRLLHAEGQAHCPAGNRPAYIGRFAPSPSGPLHAGSLVAALASWLDAHAHGGQWLLRIEDIDTPRTVPGADQIIMRQLQALGLRWDGEVVYQSRRGHLYQQAFDYLRSQGLVYPCACFRRELVGDRYPGACRDGLPPGRAARAWRVRLPDDGGGLGDFVLKRADGLWAYQLAVVVDDAQQGVTDVVRGADLLAATPGQQTLGRLLGYPPLRYRHVPLVIDPATGRKLSKQNHAKALDTDKPLETLQQAWANLGFVPINAKEVSSFLEEAVNQWARRPGGSF